MFLSAHRHPKVEDGEQGKDKRLNEANTKVKRLPNELAEE